MSQPEGTVDRPKYPGIRVVANGNQLVCYHTEARLADAGVFYPITPSTEMGELFQLSYAEGKLNVFGCPKFAIEAEGEHAAQGGAIAASITGKRVVNFTSGQGIVYGVEQYYHAPGKLSTMVVEVAARALTKHALNVHCGHDDFCGALDVGWIIVMAKDAQQAADQALILRKVTELSLTPGMNVQDGFLTSHLERTFFMHEADLIREFLGAPWDIIESPTEAQRELFGPRRRRVPEVIDLKNPALIGPVQNQEHYMNGVIARRNNFYEQIPEFFEQAYAEFGRLTGRYYGFVTEYKTEGADTVFLSLGSAAENIEAAIDHIEATRGERLGSIHLNVVRPFPAAAVVDALRGKKNVIILERTDEALAPDNPIAKDVRTALGKALDQHRLGKNTGLPSIAPEEVPRIFSGSYGLGSRDFRPEGILGAYEFVKGTTRRKDGRSAADGETYFTLGIEHPYEVVSEETPSLLPEHAIAVRLHSIGGWGMITTGKNLGAIIGAFGEDIAEKRQKRDQYGRLEEAIHVSANPKYGSEKKGAPTAYFLVVAPERVRVNCDLRHVDVVLCCDPKAFTHSNPIDGVAEGGAFVWESDEEPEKAWERIPKSIRQVILEKKIRLYVLPGFDIAKAATKRSDLQLRMQGNSFLGAFFRVSTFLQDNDISSERFREVVRRQYDEKFGRLGAAVVESNMQVMTQGFERVREVPYQSIDAKDRSRMRGLPLLPRSDGNGGHVPVGSIPMPAEQTPRINLQKTSYFDAEFRAGLGYNQPASPLAAVGTMAAATGATASKYVARRETPVFIAENCTQCMNCISACPDTALPNGAQDIGTVLGTIVENYISEENERITVKSMIGDLEPRARDEMRKVVKAKGDKPFKTVVSELLDELGDKVPEKAKSEMMAALELAPMAYIKTNATFGIPEKKNPGSGGLFSIFVSDLCKGCGECVTECGDHEALTMTPDSEELNAKVAGSTAFMNLLPDTQQKHLGLYQDMTPAEAKAASLKNHLMVLRNYQAVPSGDGACAGCGEKTVLRAIGTLTEAYMRPIYHTKARRLENKASQLKERGVSALGRFREAKPDDYARFKRAIANIVLGLGGESDADTDERINARGGVDDQEIVDALCLVMETDAFNHRSLQAVDGRLPNGMSVMAMGAHTGCNTVYGSTPPNNPHPYPWLNSLFQDGATISWLMAESFIGNHARRSVLPERFSDLLLGEEPAFDSIEYFDSLHFEEPLMTDLEIAELPKVWCVGGDGGMGDIGYQNVSKAVLQNKPNVKMLLMDTQVYSNTGGQNSDSSLLAGGFDMNQFGSASQGKLTEKKSVAESFTAGHGSAFVAQVSMADAIRLYKAILDGLEYRGTAFLQAFTTCQPEHGVGDDMSTTQAKRIRDARGMPEFVFNPQKGESYNEALDLGANPRKDRDWQEVKAKSGSRYKYTVAHWAATEARFRRHLKPVKPENVENMLHLDNMLSCITQDDFVKRHYTNKKHRAFVPDFGVYIEVEQPNGELKPIALSRQMVLLCVERRKAWRLLQSKAGLVNKDYQAQKALLARQTKGELGVEELRSRGAELLEEARKALA